jgi:hypothetical protein
VESQGVKAVEHRMAAHLSTVKVSMPMMATMREAGTW